MFNVRNTIPENGNKYYIRKSSGGWSPCIEGCPLYKPCNVLANCVGYATGRFNECAEYGYIKYAIAGNAENWWNNCPKTLEKGHLAKAKAIMVWQKGNTLSEKDGAGHVAIVEKVINKNYVFTSESGYGGSAFYNMVRKNINEWEKHSPYKFLGFIYQPDIEEDTCINDWMNACKKEGLFDGIADNEWGYFCEKAVKKANLYYNSNYHFLVEFLQNMLKMYGYDIIVDGKFLTQTQRIIKDYQRNNGLVVDGWVGMYTWKSLLLV